MVEGTQAAPPPRGPLGVYVRRRGALGGHPATPPTFPGIRGTAASSPVPYTSLPSHVPLSTLSDRPGASLTWRQISPPSESAITTKRYGPAGRSAGTSRYPVRRSSSVAAFAAPTNTS